MAEKQRSYGTWAGQNIIAPGISHMFGKDYVWLQDHDGTIYILPLDDDSVPQFV